MPSFDNTLSGDESFKGKPKIKFKHTFFQNDIVLVQLKAELTATISFTSVGDSVVSIDAPTTTTFTDYILYEYLCTFDNVGELYFYVTSELSTWQSECIEVTAEDSELLLLQWSNLDPDVSTFEFDYSTDLAIANVNFMRLAGEAMAYVPSGESTVYDNQNEKSIIKSSLFRGITVQLEKIPRPIAEVITIALQHDLLVLNDVGYVSDKLPTINASGSEVQMTINLILKTALGFNTDDIGYTA